MYPPGIMGGENILNSFKGWLMRISFFFKIIFWGGKNSTEKKWINSKVKLTMVKTYMPKPRDEHKP
jgi:hypothetical protein